MTDNILDLMKDREQLQRLILVLELFRQWNERMEVQQMLTAVHCLYLGDAERTPKNLREILDLPSSTVSRNTAQLSDIGSAERPGYDWIRLEIDRHQRNRKLIALTPKGKKLRRMIARFLRGDAVKGVV